MNPIVLQFLTLLIPVIVGIVAVPLYDLLQEGVAELKKLPAPITQILVLVFPFLANEVFKLTGVMLPSIGGYDSAAVGTVVAGLLSFVLKLAKNVSVNQKAIVATQSAVQLSHQSTLNAIAAVKVPDITVNTGK